MQCTENETLILIKRKIIDILTIIMNMQDDIRLTSFLIQFNKSDDVMVKDPFKSAAVLKYLQNVLSGQEIDQSLLEQKDEVDQQLIQWMTAAYKNKTLDMRYKSKQKDLICILLDIILY